MFGRNKKAYELEARVKSLESAVRNLLEQQEEVKQLLGKSSHIFDRLIDHVKHLQEISHVHKDIG